VPSRYGVEVAIAPGFFVERNRHPDIVIAHRSPIRARAMSNDVRCAAFFVGGFVGRRLKCVAARRVARSCRLKGPVTDME
jgi:hypothetical protein